MKRYTTDWKMRHFASELAGLIPASQIDTPAFKAWFGESKVVDTGGKPLVVYHGTDSVFDVFDITKAGSNNDTGMWGTGFYFSPDKKMSRAYGGNLKHVYLSLQNPLIVHGNVSALPWEFHPAKKTHGDAGKAASDALRQRLLDAGYDGVIQYEAGESKKLGQVVAFKPTQIKSANGQE